MPWKVVSMSNAAKNLTLRSHLVGGDRIFLAFSKSQGFLMTWTSRRVI
ncbi:hypothetical protein SAMN05443244_0988 [Terriglobus roseus]|uniref:Uncharacterized protein n=1 Tax=Terriglobus roseus TaxID=392734 RepID=A0A1H4K400_9BACT|nr:hypothetical protein SAMN05443244_0988 [Terriglobus roseus]